METQYDIKSRRFSMSVFKQLLRMISYLLYISFLFILFVQPAASSPFTIRSEGMHLKVERVVDGLNVPWGLTFLSANKLLTTERSGSVLIIDLEKDIRATLKNMPKIMVDGQGGMLDVALSPNYSKTGWVYFTYVKSVNGQGVTVLARSKIKNDAFYQWQDLLVSKSTTDTSYHFGSRIAFDENGHVFFSIGDRGVRSNGQDLTNHAGTIIRLNLDGSIPNDNPFINTKGVLPEIWSYGHRNPQGLVYDFSHKRLWSIEHGPRGGDEINLILAGKNYGWPVISHGKEYWGPLSVGEGTSRAGMEDPIKVYIPSIAPGSLMIYSSDTILKWKGNLFSGALKLQHINRVVVDQAGKEIKEERLLESMNERIRALAQSPEGWIYFSTDSGKIYRIRP